MEQVSALKLIQTPESVDSNSYIQYTRRLTNTHIRQNKAKLQKLTVRNVRKAPLYGNIIRDYIPYSATINNAPIKLNAPTASNLSTGKYGKLNKDEIQSLITYTDKDAGYINLFLNNEDVLNIYAGEHRAKFLEHTSFIYSKYDINSYLATILTNKDNACYKINKLDYIMQNIELFEHQLSSTTENLESLDIDEYHTKQIETLIRYRIINFLLFKLLFNSLAKYPQQLEPFKVFRGVKCHYLPEDINKIFYINAFVSTSTSPQLAMSKFGLLDKKHCKNEPLNIKYTNNGNITNALIKNAVDYYNLYIFYIHPKCKYISLNSISRSAQEYEVLLAPYSRYNFIKKEQYRKIISQRNGREIVIRKYYYAVLPSDLVIPNDFCEFMEWNKNFINMAPRQNAPKETYKEIDIRPINTNLKISLKPQVNEVGCTGPLCLPKKQKTPETFINKLTRLAKRRKGGKTRKLKNYN